MPDNPEQKVIVNDDSKVGTIKQTIIQNIFETDLRNQRNRKAILELVKKTWIEGVLEQSLHGVMLIELGLEEKTDAVNYPWSTQLYIDGQGHQVFPAGTKINDIFGAVDQRLLILGEPGSGKTTMLLDLARQKIGLAERNATDLIPVIFNLSTWGKTEAPIASWLVDEFAEKYYVPRKIAQAWLSNNDLLLLLDGLDEVKPNSQPACVKAINKFIEENKPKLAICSRSGNYQALGVKLNLRSAIQLLPLTSEQVDRYLIGSGMELTNVRDMLQVQQDETFQELVQSPLMLSIIALAYRGKSRLELGTFNTVRERRQHLFRTYVNSMFKRDVVISNKIVPIRRTVLLTRASNHEYSEIKVEKWLSWLAQKMIQHNMSTFLIEQLQPSWLVTEWQRLIYVIGCMLIGGVIASLIGGPTVDLIAKFGASFSPNTGMAPTVGLDVRLITCLILGSVVGLASSFRSIKPLELLSWSWKAVQEKLSLILFLTFMSGVTVALGVRLIGTHIVIVTAGLSDGVSIGVIVGLVATMSIGLRSIEIETITRPNQGIWQTARNFFTIGIVGGSVGGLILGIFMGLVSGIFEGWAYGLAFGLAFGLFGIFVFGLTAAFIHSGIVVIQHLVIRSLLSFNDYLPWDIAGFLNYATERIFIRKIGGSYIFIHRLLLEYFAGLNQNF